MLKRVPIYPNIIRSNYNNNNIHEYDPYLQNENENLTIIDADWWNSLTYYIKKLIEMRLNNKFKLGQITIPHELSQSTNDNKNLKIIYQSYLDGFDYNVWYTDNIPNGPKNVKIIHIPDTIKKILFSIYMKEISRSTDKNDINMNVDIYAFKNEINKNMEIGKEYFVRLSSTSGKNVKQIDSFTNADDIISHLVSNKLFVTQEYCRDKDTYLILVPWNDIIDSRCEFRIFVVNNKLTAASPQKFWELHQYSSEELKSIEHALSNISFINSVIYHTFVADIYVNMETQTCHLIELNPFGAHCGAGSSLFNWITDYDVLHGLSQPELRYLSIINY